MPTAPPNAAGIELFYETFGEPDGEPLLFVMGLGAQGHVWADDFVQAFVDRGFFAIRFDNRDVGLSTKPRGHRRRRGDRGHPVGLRRGGGGGAVRPRRLGGGRGEPARPPRHRVRPRRRGVDGRHDRPADGHRPPRAGPVRSRRSCRPPGTPTSASPIPTRWRRCCSSPRATSRDDAIASSVAVGRAISSPAHFDEEHVSAPCRGLLRPLLLPGGRRPPAPGRHRLAVAAPRRSARSTCRRS